MALADDIADDYESFDGVEDVTFTPQTPVATAITSVKALRRVLSRNEMAFGTAVGISPDDTVFHLWKSTMGVTPPSVNPGDIITDASNVVCTVIQAQLTTLSTRWRCVCKKQR